MTIAFFPILSHDFLRNLPLLLMKNSLLAGSIAVFTALASPAFATIIADDAFNVGGTNEYTAGDITGQNPSATGTGWVGGWTSSKGNAELRFLGTNNTNLPTYSDGTFNLDPVNSGSAGSISVQSTGAGFATYRRDFSGSNISGPSDEIYFSFEIDMATNPSTSWGIRLVDTAGSARYDIRGGTGDIAKIRVGNNIFDGGGTIFGADSTVNWTDASFMVGRITGVTTSNTTFDLWVNPTDLTDITGGAVAATVTTTTASSSGVAGIQLGFANGDDNSFIDNLRIGESFGDVVPVTLIPEPTSASLMVGGLSLLLLRRRR